MAMFRDCVESFSSSDCTASSPSAAARRSTSIRACKPAPWSGNAVPPAPTCSAGAGSRRGRRTCQRVSVPDHLLPGAEPNRRVRVKTADGLTAAPGHSLLRGQATLVDPSDARPAGRPTLRRGVYARAHLHAASWCRTSRPSRSRSAARCFGTSSPPPASAPSTDRRDAEGAAGT